MDGPGRDPRGQLVRPFAVTRGRTAPRRPIAIEAVLMAAVGRARPAATMDPHKQLIASLLAEQPLSLAELAAYCRLPLGVCRVLVADMVTDGVLMLHEPTADVTDDVGIDILERLLVALRQL